MTANFAVYRGMKLSHDDLIRQYVISEIMCNFRLNLTEMNRRFNIDARNYLRTEFQELQPFESDGLLIDDGKTISITGPGRIFVRNIAMTFDAYLRRAHDKPKVQFSRTI